MDIINVFKSLKFDNIQIAKSFVFIYIIAISNIYLSKSNYNIFIRHGFKLLVYIFNIFYFISLIQNIDNHKKSIGIIYLICSILLVIIYNNNNYEINDDTKIMHKKIIYTSLLYFILLKFSD